MTAKKSLSLILCTIMLVCLACVFTSGSYAAADPEIRVGTASAGPGEEVVINVDFLNNPGINSYTLSINYDAERLQLLSADPDPAVGGQFAFSKKAVWLASADTTYSGTFLTLKFKVLENAAAGEASVSVSYNPGDICNRNEDDVNFAVTGGYVTVGGGSGQPEQPDQPDPPGPQTGTISVGHAEGLAGENVTLNVDFLNNPGVNSYTLCC